MFHNKGTDVQKPLLTKNSLPGAEPSIRIEGGIKSFQTKKAEEVRHHWTHPTEMLK